MRNYRLDAHPVAHDDIPVLYPWGQTQATYHDKW